MTKKNNWGGYREECKKIKKFHDQWCNDNGYSIKQRKRVKKTQIKSNFITFNVSYTYLKPITEQIKNISTLTRGKSYEKIS